VRYCYLLNGPISDHGTEGGAERDIRAKEIYNNLMDNRGGLPAGNRGGTSLYHDNTVIGVSPLGICNFTCNRTGYLRATPVWGLSDGTSVWDENDTEGNGTFVEGHPPHLFESGTASETTAEGTLTDTTKNWPTNHWVGYMVRQVNPGGVELASYIKSNTATTITYALFSWGNNHMIFNSGMGYQIHRLLFSMDQNGAGKTDPIAVNAQDKPYLVSTGQPGFPHPARESCYGWNNIYGPTGAELKMRQNTGQPVTIEGIDYFNLGTDLSGTPPAVSNRYTAALNGVQYTGPFQYPHPLVSGTQPSPTPTGTPSPTAAVIGVKGWTTLWRSFWKKRHE
jgi:hypothetical protein